MASSESSSTHLVGDNVFDLSLDMEISAGETSHGVEYFPWEDGDLEESISVTAQKPEAYTPQSYSINGAKPEAQTPQLPGQSNPYHVKVSNMQNGKAESDSMADTQKKSSASSSTHVEIDHVVVRMREIVEQELNSQMDHIPATIFQVPNSVTAVKPESYAPQMIGLGPLHHFRPEVSYMLKGKVAAVKRFLCRHPNFNIDDVGKEDEPRIRACYDKLLDFKGDSLVWMTVIDALFLSELLSTHFKINQEQERGYEYSVAGKELVQNAILRDVMMLENQIPLFLLQQIALKVGTSSSLPQILLAFCKAMSPFNNVKEEEKYVELVQETCPHLLCLLYILVVPIETPPKMELRIFVDKTEEAYSGVVQILETAANVNAPFFDSIKKPTTVLLGLLKLPFSKLKTPFASRDISGGKNPLLVKDAVIPPASSLTKAGVIFKPNTKDIRDFDFMEEEAVLYLPVIKLGVNSEVILRNLVAFEALLGSSSRSQPELNPFLNHSACKAMEAATTHVLARYTKLMDGILENANDVKILRDAGIIKGHLESDEDVAKLFSGMSVSSGLAAEDETIKKLNNFYNNSQRIKMHKFMRKCGSILYGSLQFIVVVLLLALMAVQTFCSVYSCSHVFKYAL
ncbi:hypothetical protein HS088_TW04G00124 [Tripterygium wilfordii]|uniref:Uncharacterized protein n=1 Tax=Tripterygium wilfordii TaxID=458696 RepID=A0A7J7DPP5_TRIWF|nr:putative UPF0481 protein At3g02645 [Tripterygium wilfordii]KAF5748174.1 hypothetical protein HS088_TW04G00124 [Tripterygium wilfordii]